MERKAVVSAIKDVDFEYYPFRQLIITSPQLADSVPINVSKDCPILVDTEVNWKRMNNENLIKILAQACVGCSLDCRGTFRSKY